MSFQVKGKVIEVCAEVAGTSAAGKEWSKRDFVIEELDGQYPKRIAFTAFNKPDIFNFFGLHDEVTVHFNAESKEFKEKWFTNLTIWKVDVDVKSAGSSAPDSGLQKNPPPPPPPDDMMPADGTEPDLPF
jgi:hypothetical protein